MIEPAEASGPWLDVSGEVRVWFARLGASPPVKRLLPLLAEDEVDRARRFRSLADRDLLVVGRAGLRCLLARVLRRNPSTLRFGYGSLGKPSLIRSAGDPDVRFSLSHAGDLVVWAVTLGREVGIDVEHVRPEVVDEDLIRTALSPLEIRYLDGASAQRQAEYFFRCWTVKEAYSKALGLGLSIRMADLEVLPELIAGDTTRLPPSILSAPVSVRSFPLLTDYRTALAVEGAIDGVDVSPVEWG